MASKRTLGQMTLLAKSQGEAWQLNEFFLIANGIIFPNWSPVGTARNKVNVSSPKLWYSRRNAELQDGLISTL